MIEWLSYPFFQNAVLMMIVTSVLCGVIGSLVVVRRLAFLSGGIAHSAFGGVGISYFYGFNPAWGATIFGVVAAMVLSLLKNRLDQREDSLIGMVWAGGMAIGILCIYATDGYASDLFGYLFGNLLIVTHYDIGLTFVVTAVAVGMVVWLYRAIQAVSYDPQYAVSINLPVVRLELMSMVLVGLSIMALIRVVGVVLVVAMLTIPANTALLMSRSLKRVMASAVGICMVTGLAGLGLAAGFDWPPGPLIILLNLAVYAVTLGLYRR